MIIISKKNPTVRLFSPDRNRIEGDALQQLEKTAALPGIDIAVGLPDLHPGKGGPVGAAFMSRDIIYPHLIGSDVGCGMALWQTNLKLRKLKRDKWAKKLSGFESPWEGDADEWLARYHMEASPFDDALGTIGGGNHFAELQAVEKVINPDAFNAIGLDKKDLTVLVHSGSRGLGASLLRRHTDHYGGGGLDTDSDEALHYLEGHNSALKWAEASRGLIAHRFMTALGTSGRPVLDVSHNSIFKVQTDGRTFWLHRKGVVPSDRGPVVIPGTRGSLTYLVEPVGDQTLNAWSVAHGAGRKWNRKSVKGRIKGRFNVNSLLQTDLGGTVICEDRELLYQEAPQAYKNIDQVIRDITEEGLIRPVASFRPVITYKVRQKS